MTNKYMNEEKNHLDLLRIDAVRTGEGTAAEEEHVKDCPVCLAELEELEAAAERLKAGVPPTAEVPFEVGRVIKAEFKRRFPGRRAPARVLFPVNWKSWAVPALGAAAAVILVLAVTIPGIRKINGPRFRPVDTAEQPSAVVSEAAGGDVNGDGRVDILDAYRLAVFIEQEIGTALKWDINKDGRVDLLDVDAVARLAVAL